MVASIASDLLAVHNKDCMVDILRFPQMTYLTSINPEMRNCFSACPGKECFYLGLVDGIAEYDTKTFTKQKSFQTKSYVYNISHYDDNVLILGQKEGYLQVITIKDFALLVETQLSDRQSIGEIRRTTRSNEVMIATAKGVVFAHLTRLHDNEYSFSENFSEKYTVSKGVDSVIEYQRDRIATCTSEGISLINRETKEMQFYLTNGNGTTPRFIREIPGLDLKKHPYILFRD